MIHRQKFNSPQDIMFLLHSLGILVRMKPSRTLAHRYLPVLPVLVQVDPDSVVAAEAAEADTVNTHKSTTKNPQNSGGFFIYTSIGEQYGTYF